MTNAVDRSLLPRFRRAFFHALELRRISKRAAARQLGLHEQTVLSWTRRGPSPAMQERVLAVFPEISEFLDSFRPVNIVSTTVRRRGFSEISSRLMTTAAARAAAEVATLELPSTTLQNFWWNSRDVSPLPPAEHARAIRAALMLGNAPIARMEEVLEQLGMPCVPADIEGTGASSVDVEIQVAHERLHVPVIVFWGSPPDVGHRLELAVEAGYARTPNQITGRAKASAVNEFADELLAPLAGLIQWLPMGGADRPAVLVDALAATFIVPPHVVSRQFVRAGYRITADAALSCRSGSFFQRIISAQAAWKSCR